MSPFATPSAPAASPIAFRLLTSTGTSVAIFRRSARIPSTLPLTVLRIPVADVS
jgi:hypothetical protein